MRAVRLRMLGFLGALTFVAPARASEEMFDRIEQALTGSAYGGQVRARLSGTLDLEGYRFALPAPALLQTTERRLLAPRLSLFLDAQVGARTYVFAQARVDRGFDPANRGGQIRLDEYALRFSVRRRGRVQVQVGKFATVVGNWTARHGSWANPFVTAPLVYENLTGIWDTEAVPNSNVLLQWSHVRPGLPARVTAFEKSLRVPVAWGPSYATGAAIAGDIGRWRYALEVKEASLSSRPETWGHEAWSHPTVSGRIGYQPDARWNFGLSASAGSYLRTALHAPLPAGRSRGDYRQLVLAHDLSFAWHHFQWWSELYATRFEIPGVGDAETVAYYAEAKYKFTAQWFGALRWNRQIFGHIPDRGGRAQWGRNAARADLAAGYRFSAHTQLKLQYNLQQGDTQPHRRGELWAAQMTVRF